MELLYSSLVQKSTVQYSILLIAIPTSPPPHILTAVKLTRINITRRYGTLTGPTSRSCGGLQPLFRALFALREKSLLMLFCPILGHFCCSVVPLNNFSIDLNKNKKNTLQKFWTLKNLKKSKKFLKIYIYYLISFCCKTINVIFAI